MLRRLRWKFTGMAMLAVSAVLVVIVLSINVIYQGITVKDMDRMLSVIADNDGRIPPYAPRDREGGKAPWTLWLTPETRFETRFFVVREGRGKDVPEKQMDSIASVTAEEAEAYYEQAAASGKSAGFIGKYRFYGVIRENDTFFIFLDCTRQLRAVHNLRLASALVTIAALLGTFAAAWLMSGKAVEPTVQSMERQKRFITDASHEIKTPLTVIRSYAEVMCMEDEENEWAQGIQKETQRLSRLVSNLVLLARWDEEAPTTQKREFDLSRALWDTLTPYQNLAKANGKWFKVDISDGLVITGDEGAIQTAFATLFENAVQYSLPESEIAFSARREKRRIAVCLVNASELPEELDVNRLFDRFYRADPARVRGSGGSGVGLSLARAIIEAHDGKISAEREGQLVRFHIALPA